MGGIALLDAKVYLDGYDLSGELNEGALEDTIAMLNATTFGQTTEVNQPGLESVKGSYKGLWRAAGGAPRGPDDVLGSLVASGVLSFWTLGNTEGDRGYAMPSAIAKYRIGDKIGVLLPFDVELAGAGPLIRPALMATGTKSSSGNGSVIQLGAVGSAQKLYAFLHVFAPPAGTLPTIDVLVKSSAVVGFTTPTTRVAFAQVTGAGTPKAQWATPVAGSITDQYWRVDWTIGGTGLPSFKIAVGVAIE